MQAVVLVGGEGSRLRPLTATVPKPVLPFVDRPFLAYMLGWLHGHGVDEVVLACGFAPDRVRAVLGDGSGWGVRLHYVEEPEPRGTGGALRECAPLLHDRFLMLNGDSLTDIDLGAQLAQHERTGAVGTLALVPVDDPSAFGLVRLGEGSEIAAFLEKPEPHEIDTDLISAGAYVLERSVLDLIPAGRVSIEREVWPRLVGAGLHGFADRRAYWLDIGSPEGYLRGTCDVLRGAVRTAVEVGDRPVHVAPSAEVAAGARVGDCVVLGPGARVEPGADLERAVVLANAWIGAGALLRDCVVAPGARVGRGARLTGGTLVGEAATIPDGAVLDGVKVPTS
jgi:mannose-1-phosphate guanylyltransferase